MRREYVEAVNSMGGQWTTAPGIFNHWSAANDLGIFNESEEVSKI